MLCCVRLDLWAESKKPRNNWERFIPLLDEWWLHELELGQSMVSFAGGNVMCLHLWGRQSGPYIQALHFAFGLGAFVSPLVAEPFLSKQANTTKEGVPPGTGAKPEDNDGQKLKRSVDTAKIELVRHKRDEEATTKTPTGKDQRSKSGIGNILKPQTKVEFAYLIVALIVLLVAICFVVVCCMGPCTWRATQVEPADNQFFIRKETMGFRVQILLLLFVFYFLYVGMEVTYGGLILTFAVQYLDWKKDLAVLLNSSFWGSFAFGRLAAIFFAKCVSAPVMLVMDLILCGLASAALVFGVNESPSIIWIGTVMLGLGMASIFPTGIVWAEKYMAVTGKATAIFVVGSALGEMLVPLVTGLLFNWKSEMWLFYTILSGVLVSLILFIIMQNLASNMGDKYQSLRLGAIDAEETDVDMDEIHIASNGQDAGGRGPGWKKRVTFQLEKSKKKAAIQQVKSSAKRDWNK